jgi:hypothetical protein
VPSARVSSPPSAGLTRKGRPARAPAPAALAPVRALLGAAVAVAGVALGIGTLLWASDAPVAGERQGPVVTDAAAPAPQTGPTDGPDDAAAVDRPSVEPPVKESAAAPPAAPPPAPAPPAPPARTQPASVVVPVTVLNNSRETGLAARAAARFEDGGWPVRATGNYTGRLRETTVYYAAGQEAAARSFARTFRGITRVLPRFDRLPGEGLTVVLTRHFPA